VTSSIASRPAKPVRSAEFPTCPALDLLEADQLRLGLDLGDDVRGSPLGRDVVEGLLDLAALLDDELEDVLAGLGRVLDGHRDVVAARAGVDRLHAVRGLVRAVAGTQLGPRGRSFLTVAVAADAHDVRGAAPVQEVAVHRVREVRAVDELAERLRVLRPVRHQYRLVDGSLLREPHERRNGGAHPLDGLGARRDFLDVDAR
jgi:hypothetical protein